MSKKKKLVFWINETDMDYRAHVGSEKFEASSVKEADKHVEKMNRCGGGFHYSLDERLLTEDGEFVNVNEYRQKFEKKGKKKEKKKTKHVEVEIFNTFKTGGIINVKSFTK